MGITVSAIDSSDQTGRWAWATRINHVSMTGVADMVAKVLKYLNDYVHTPACCVLHASAGAPQAGAHGTWVPGAGTTKMSRLNIIDHGNLGQMDFGTEPVTTASFASFRPEFAKLAPKFEADGFVHLQHCFAACNITLMTMFADVFNVPVVGGDGLTHSWARLNLGNFTRVYPLRGGSRQASDTFFWGP